MRDQPYRSPFAVAGSVMLFILFVVALLLAGFIGWQRYGAQLLQPPPARATVNDRSPAPQRGTFTSGTFSGTAPEQQPPAEQAPPAQVYRVDVPAQVPAQASEEAPAVAKPAVVYVTRSERAIEIKKTIPLNPSGETIVIDQGTKRKGRP